MRNKPIERWNGDLVPGLEVSDRGRVYSGRSHCLLTPRYFAMDKEPRWYVMYRATWYDLERLVEASFNIKLPDGWGPDMRHGSKGRTNAYRGPVYCAETRRTYNSFGEAAEDTGLSRNYIAKLTRGAVKSPYWHFSKVVS